MPASREDDRPEKVHFDEADFKDVAWSPVYRYGLICRMACCFGKRKSILRFDGSKDHCKRTYLLRFVFVSPKQQIILQVSVRQ